MKIDLHMHTKFSDGGLDLQELFDKLNQSGVRFVSITDHNNLCAYDKLKKVNTHNISILQGIEVDVLVGEQVVHILLYGFDRENNAMQKYLAEVRDKDISEFKRMIAEVEKSNNIQINRREIENFVRRNEYFDKVRLNNLLTEQGLAKSAKDAFYMFTKDVEDKKRYALPVDDFFDLARSSGAVSVLAHPFKYLKWTSQSGLQKLMLDLKFAGLDGVEVYNNRQTEDQQEWLLKFAKENNFLISGGSDFHSKIGVDETKNLGFALGKQLTKDLISENFWAFCVDHVLIKN